MSSKPVRARGSPFQMETVRSPLCSRTKVDRLNPSVMLKSVGYCRELWSTQIAQHGASVPGTEWRSGLRKDA